MLNQNDRRRLEEIERQLLSEDPDFVRHFAQGPPSSTRPSRVWQVVVLVAGVLVMLLSLLALLPAVFFLALAATVGGWAWLRRRNRHDAGPAAAHDG